jgi:hypothetical protein
MKEIIKYKFFGCSEDFEKWQEEYTRRVIVINPIPNSMSLTQKDNDINSNKISFGVFVTYWELPSNHKIEQTNSNVSKH